MSYQPLLEQGIRHLQRSNFTHAIDAFTLAINQGAEDLSVWLGLALSLRGAGQHEKSLQVLDNALQHAPNDVSLLNLKGQIYLDLGQKKHAIQCLGRVVNILESSPSRKHEDSVLLAQVKGQYQTLNRELDATCQLALKQAGFDNRSPARFHQALALMRGEKNIYPQQPRAFFYPELPTIQFFDTSIFDWVPKLQDSVDLIEKELDTLLDQQMEFSPYIQSHEQGSVGGGHALADNPNWGACFLIKNGEVNAELRSACPLTFALVKQLPLAAIPKRSPMALFSRLKAGTRIAPHHGFFNTRLICHLPVKVPDNCYLRVGNDTRKVERGKVMIFDDSIEHEAWNDSSEDRIVLIFDIWRPELSDDERMLISALVSATDNYA